MEQAESKVESQRIRVDSWLEQAEQDWRAAKINYQGGNYDWSSFLCLEAVKKSLKAFLHFKGVYPVPTEISVLFEDAEKDPKLSSIRNKSRNLLNFASLLKQVENVVLSTGQTLVKEADTRKHLSQSAAIVKLVRELTGGVFKGLGVASERDIKWLGHIKG